MRPLLLNAMTVPSNHTPTVQTNTGNLHTIEDLPVE